MSRFHVGGKVVDTVDLLRKRHWGWRLDMWPFTILYGVWLAAVVPSLDFGDASIVLGGILAFHVLVFLFTVWSVDFKCFVQYSKITQSNVTCNVPSNGVAFHHPESGNIALRSTRCC
ncbi:UNVERIFIED_CONTAM: putative manganese-transporting ATPase PDR2 [Sesamum angustifolium]|uniref:Manganese-transporting ATPase PDR2 n=1 Tax=Sesamum angustifolium TaxID=2727405 RepID=A0AAW2KMF8_9LAMI